MMPFYFGSSGRSLFGIYEAPAVAAAPRGIVVCNTIGGEYYFAHRTCRLLTQRLASAGLHALRFDQLGIGDSALDIDDVRWEDWVGCVAEAVDELRDMAGITSVGVVGLRLGADLAAEAAARCSLERLVLWDPIPDRTRFVAELDPPELVRCFPDEWAANRAALHALPPRTMLVCSREDADRFDTLAVDVARQCPEFRRDTTGDASAWRSGEHDVGRLPVPISTIESIVDWCVTA